MFLVLHQRRCTLLFPLMHFYIAAIINRQRAIPVILTVMILPGETCADGEVNVNWMCVAVAFREILLTQLPISVMHSRIALT